MVATCLPTTSHPPAIPMRHRKKQQQTNGLGHSSARARLIESAGRLFCRFGINAIGIDAIIADAGVAKASLYKNFGSKDALVEVVLEHEGTAWRDWFLGELHKGNASSDTKLQRIFPLLKTWFAGENFFGCPFINAIGEHDKQDNRLRQAALRHKRAILDAIADLARDSAYQKPAEIAHRLGLLMDGAIVAAMVTGNPAHADTARKMAKEILSHANKMDAAK